jgi:hypothetical protein
MGVEPTRTADDPGERFETSKRSVWILLQGEQATQGGPSKVILTGPHAV